MRPAYAVIAFAATSIGCYRPGPAPVVSGGDVSMPPTISGVTLVADVGFDAPENLVYDSVADVFLVSNMGGQGATHDDNGFISRVGPDGKVLDLKWIAGGRNGVVLDAPKGLAIRGDTLAIADIGGVHLFDRRSGTPIKTIAVPGQVMNDVAFASDGSIWVTDTGPDRSTTPIDTTKDMDAVWRIAPSGAVKAVARGLRLDRPDGLALDGGSALVATFGADRLERVGTSADSASTVLQLPGGRVDGLRRLSDGSYLVSSWDARAVWRWHPGSAPRLVMSELTSPAGVALDTRRQRLAVTSMQGNALYLTPLR